MYVRCDRVEPIAGSHELRVGDIYFVEGVSVGHLEEGKTTQLRLARLKYEWPSGWFSLYTPEVLLDRVDAPVYKDETTQPGRKVAPLGRGLLDPTVGKGGRK